MSCPQCELWVGSRPYARVARGRTHCSKPSARWHLPGDTFFSFHFTLNIIKYPMLNSLIEHRPFLHWSPDKVGKLVSVDDEDQARVSFFADSPAVNADSPDLSFQPESSSSTVLTLPLDRLCKVSMTWPGILSHEFWINCVQLIFGFGRVAHVAKTQINSTSTWWKTP